MRRSRMTRRFVAIVSIAALVLGHALIAAHACVLPAPADQTVDACHHEEPEPASGALCKAHCEAGQQMVDQAKPLATPDLATPLLVVAVDDLAARAYRSVAAGAGWLARAGAPPPLLLTGRLRI
jgi:hypothetical protein